MASYVKLLICCAGLGLCAGGCQRHGPWQTLFDGSDASAWRGIHSDSLPGQRWFVRDGLLICDPVDGAAHDIITREQYGNFELELEFRMTKGANSGIKYFVVEALSRPRRGLGPEYQILDDDRHPDAKAGIDNNRTLASLYDILPPRDDKPVRPVGQWNTARLVSYNRRVEHWLNGVNVLTYYRDDPAVRQKIADSKFKNDVDFALAEKGHVLLQDHNDTVYFRNIRIRELH